MFGCVENRWECRLSAYAERKNTWLECCLYCSQLHVFTVSTDACTYSVLCSFHHGRKFFCHHRAQTHSLAEFLEAVCLLWSFSNYKSQKLLSWMLVQFDVQPVLPHLCHLQNCSFVGRQVGKANTSSAAATCQFLRIGVFSWADPISEGPYLSQHSGGHTGDAWCMCQD